MTHKENRKGAIMENRSKEVSKSEEKRESVRGKLDYYQELMHQQEKKEREEYDIEK